MSATAALLDTIIEKAPQLRHAGVLRVQIEGLSFDLAPTEPAFGGHDDDRDKEEVETADPLDDPTTYGGVVPGYRRRERGEDH